LGHTVVIESKFFQNVICDLLRVDVKPSRITTCTTNNRDIRSEDRLDSRNGLIRGDVNPGGDDVDQIDVVILCLEIRRHACCNFAIIGAPNGIGESDGKLAFAGNPHDRKSTHALTGTVGTNHPATTRANDFCPGTQGFGEIRSQSPDGNPERICSMQSRIALTELTMSLRAEANCNMRVLL